MTDKTRTAILTQYKAGDEFGNIAATTGIPLPYVRGLIVDETTRSLSQHKAIDETLYARRRAARITRGLTKEDA